MNDSEVLLNEEHHLTGTGLEGEQDLTADDKQLLKDLVHEWQRYQRRGLATRHHIGSLLNDRFGPPTQRQPRGQKVLKLAAERMHSSVSELSRMRWFAHIIASPWDLVKMYPVAKSWTQFKEFLPRIKLEDVEEENASPKPQGAGATGPSCKPEGKRGQRRLGRVPSPTSLREATKSLQKVASKLRRVKHLTEAERQKFLKKLQGFVKVAEIHLGIRVTFELVRGDESVAV